MAAWFQPRKNTLQRLMFADDGAVSAGVEIEPATASIDPNTALQLRAKRNGVYTSAITWRLLLGAGATVSSTGLVQVSDLAAQVVVRATSSVDPSQYAEITINVAVPSLGITSVQALPQAITLSSFGQTALLNVVVTADDGIDDSYTYTVQGSSIRVVAATDTIEAIAQGFSILRVASSVDPRFFDEVRVNVEPYRPVNRFASPWGNSVRS